MPLRTLHVLPGWLCHASVITLRLTMLRAALVSLLLASGSMAQDRLVAEFGAQQEFVAFYCFDCHGGDVVKGELDLSVALGDPAARLHRLSRLRARSGSHEMPPRDAEQPAAAERGAFVAWIDDTLRREVPELPPSPGRVTVRRLNSAQWERTVMDLFGVGADTSGFPADDLGYGFDTVGDAMAFSTLHLEKYLAAAGEVAAAVITGEDPDNPTKRRFEAEAMTLVGDRGATMYGDYVNLYTRAELAQQVELPRAGRYRIIVSAGASRAGDELAEMRVTWDREVIERWRVPARRYREVEIELPLAAGSHRLGLAFTNDYYDPKNPDKSRRDRNLYIDWAEVVGPLDPAPIPAEQRWVHDALAGGESPIDRLTSFVAALLPRLWRRPVTAAERERYVDFARAALADSTTEPVEVTTARRVLQAALTSPNFLFRGEGMAGGGGAVPGLALASRLSYFLWSSTPDARLLELGSTGAFADPAVLLAEVDRLLADPRADALATEFAAQWLELRNLRDTTPDPERFPVFDDALRASLRRETELLFVAVMRDDLDVRTLLDCDFTHLDARLAALYGIERPADAAADEFVRVPLPASHRRRGGVLGHGSILAVTSNPTRTSPVKRGKWILENIVGEPPPPPPPGNDSLSNEEAIDSSQSFREQLAQHREDSKCAVCHDRMDALGLALERFDAIGRFRESDAGGVIDCSGELPGGVVVDGITDLKAVLRADPAFVRTLLRKLFVFGVGRAPRPVDELRLDLAAAMMLERGPVTIRDLVRTIVLGDAFRLRRAAAVR